MKKRPIVLLIRRIVDDAPVWLLHSEHCTEEHAERSWERQIKGRGVTAWSWWGPRRIADKMLADAQYDPDTDAIPVADPR